eukprot:310732-Ditylum_brightwellii.AAC.1
MPSSTPSSMPSQCDVTSDVTRYIIEPARKRLYMTNTHGGGVGHGTLSTDCPICVHNYIPSRIDCDETQEANAYYILREDDNAVFARLAVENGIKILLSDEFTGCVFELWRGPINTIWANHVYEGTKFCHNTNQMEQAPGWNRIYQFKTGGLPLVNDKPNEKFIIVLADTTNVRVLIFDRDEDKAAEHLEVSFPWNPPNVVNPRVIDGC